MPRKLTTEEFIERAKLKHGDRYCYDLVEYKGIDIKIKILCSIHGIFQQSPYKHINGQNCPKCSKISSSNKLRKSTEEFIKESKKMNKNIDYKYVDYKNNHTPVILVCDIHGKFEQKPLVHLQGCGCPKCANNIAYNYDKNIPTYDTYQPQLEPYGIECRRSQDNKNILEIKCHSSNCDKWFVPNVTSITSKIWCIKGYRSGESNIYCSLECKNGCLVYKKHSKQRDSYTQSQFRELILDEYGTNCERCGKEGISVDVHHIKPLAGCNVDILLWDKDNGMVVCKNCHHSKIHVGECSTVKLRRIKLSE